ncbi:hypothetical protein PHMEG_00017006 [Phytophthora megakarya]|uniref:Ubiquitin-like protease family profile domain-containing protein n=1 Tax=Phytophthora megakarya TaxID=4795 RepID=A0A225VYG6_9STRA|nr:hypothetical protein PHMEG_00017006 [Phytophthora megakarya]
MSQKVPLPVKSNIHILKLPASISKKTRCKNSEGERIGVIDIGCDCPIELEDFIFWAVKFNDLQRVQEIINRYPVRLKESFILNRIPSIHLKTGKQSTFLFKFLVPKKVLTLLQSELLQWTTREKYVETLDCDENDSFPVAYLGTTAFGFSLKYTQLVDNIYTIREVVQKYKQDFTWVDRDWSDSRDSAIAFSTPCSRTVQRTAQDVLQVLAESWLNRKFKFNCGDHGTGGEVELQNFVGFVAHKARLNDTIMHCALQSICAKLPRCFAVDPVNVYRNNLIISQQPLSNFSFIVVPVYLLELQHWMVLIVELEGDISPDGVESNTKLVLYDPIGTKDNFEAFDTTWKSYILPLLQKWVQRDREHNQSTHKTNITDNQNDGVSCGVFCLVQAYNYIVGNRMFAKETSLSTEDLNVVRLSIMWEIICNCDSVEQTTDDFNLWRKCFLEALEGPFNASSEVRPSLTILNEDILRLEFTMNVYILRSTLVAKYTFDLFQLNE